MNLSQVHDKQSSLMNQYHAIEMKVCGQLNHPTRIIHPHEWQSVHVQDHIRLIIWRGIEELAEAGREEIGSLAFKTELIDALHFFTEANLFCGLTYDDLNLGGFEKVWQQYGTYPHGPFTRQLSNVTSAYADATYWLKSKPWKQTPKHTEVEGFIKSLSYAYEAVLRLLQTYMKYDEAMAIYFGKAAENVQRQNTGY